jgi:hypothetical protein
VTWGLKQKLSFFIFLILISMAFSFLPHAESSVKIFCKARPTLKVGGGYF